MNGNRLWISILDSAAYILQMTSAGPRFVADLAGAGRTIINGGDGVVCYCHFQRGREVTALEGLQKWQASSDTAAWIDEQVPQCGFCQNSQMMTAKAAAGQESNHLTDAQIRVGGMARILAADDVLPVQLPSSAAKAMAGIVTFRQEVMWRAPSRTFRNRFRRIGKNGTASRRTFLKSSGLLS